MTDKKARSVKQWPEGERPRERLAVHGPASLSKGQLLAIIIKYYKAGRTALDLAMALLAKSSDFAEIEQAGIKDICEEPGMWPAKAAEIKAAIEPGRWFQKSDPSIASSEPLRLSETMVQYYQSTLKISKKEFFHCVLLDHIIIGAGYHFSFRDNGMIGRIP
jgi:DNA repair protein RadC